MNVDYSPNESGEVHSRANPLVVIGGQKCGTATLVSDLGSCTYFDISKDKKESSPLLFSGSDEDFEQILKAMVSPAGSAQILVDVSTRYTCFPEVSVPFDLIRKNLPDAKFVYLVRNPYERTLSHHHHDTVLGLTHRSALEDITENSAYVKNSMYGMQAKMWIDSFGCEKILLVKFENYINNRKETISAICDFAGVSDDGVEHVMSDKAENVTSIRPKFPSVVAAFIRSPFYVKIIKLVFPLKVRQLLKSGLGKQHNLQRSTLPDEMRYKLIETLSVDNELLQSIYPDAPKW